jgi:hypothetical protein
LRDWLERTAAEHAEAERRYLASIEDAMTESESRMMDGNR